MLPPVTHSAGQRAGALARDGRRAWRARVSGIAATLALCAGPVTSQDPPPAAEDRARATVETGRVPRDAIADARALADEALAGTGESPGAAELNAWARSVIDGALERAGAASETSGMSATVEADPLPAGRHAAQVASGPTVRRGTAEVLVFMSLAVPQASWTQWAAQAARTGAPLVLRGVAPEGLRATAIRVGRRLGGHEAGVAIDPRLFRLFGIERVPAVVAVPGGVPACVSRGCADDAPPPFDAVSGNIGLAAALEAIAAEGEDARETARRHLERLGRRP